MHPFLQRRIAVALLGLGVLIPSSLFASDAHRSHPRLIADSVDIAQARAWMEESTWYRSIIHEHKAEIDSFIIRKPVFVSPIKQIYEFKMYTCPTHDVELIYDEASPYRHGCPEDSTESYSGGKYDAAWAGWYNRLLADRLVWMGILYQLKGDVRYAEAGREVLLGFARLYLRYPTDNTILGPAHATRWYAR